MARCFRLAVFLCVIVSVHTAEKEIKCYPNVCNQEMIPCNEPNATEEECHGQLSDFGGGLCGCCPVCLPFKGEGEDCSEIDYANGRIGGNPGACTSHLKCIKGKCVHLLH